MKKKNVLFMLILLGLCVFAIEPAFAANISSCDAVIKDAIIDEKIPNIISTIVTVIKVAVPVLLVIFGMLDLMKGIIAQKEDEIKKGQQIFIKRLIAGALVFFVFMIVQLIISFVADSGEKDNIMDCANCFINGECTYRFTDETNKTCPTGKVLNKENTKCIKK